MPIVKVDILTGRDDDTKRVLAEKLTQAVSEALNLPPEATHVVIEEHDRANWAIGGVRFSDKTKTS
ncbi:MAG: 4-oxalocrotonate tautomerase family protein [Neomegalonema sp.]|nr:4-oxalocrotonate tautomerase family protein [Neomegalonema sp.]